MNDETPALSTLSNWGAKSLEGLKAFAKRLFAHLVILTCAGAAAFSSGSVLAGLCVYTGGICIFARGAGLNRTWIIPAAFGALQTLFLIGCGLPPHEAIFWGGVQSFAQRLIHKRGQVGGEWFVVLFILPTAFYLLPASPLVPLAASLAGFAIFGLLAAKMLARQQARAERLETLGKQGPLPPEKVRIYQKSLDEFKAKIEELTEPARSSALSIAGSVKDILDCMANDERDTEPGHRFLNRYFKAAHSVVDKHLVLAKETRISRETIQTLAKSRETLLRLSEAFAKEQIKLRKNDVTDFSADLAVIDTLLKMDGL